MTSLMLALSALMLSACITPITSTVDVYTAQKAVDRAEQEGARDKAPYEFFMAREMLRKADEEWGYAEYGQSTDYADLALKYAEQARAKARTSPWEAPPPEVLDPSLAPQGGPGAGGEAPTTPTPDQPPTTP